MCILILLTISLSGMNVFDNNKTMVITVVISCIYVLSTCLRHFLCRIYVEFSWRHKVCSTHFSTGVESTPFVQKKKENFACLWYYGFHDRCFFSTGDLFCSQGAVKYYPTRISTKDIPEQEGQFSANSKIVKK